MPQKDLADEVQVRPEKDTLSCKISIGNSIPSPRKCFKKDICKKLDKDGSKQQS